MNPDYGVFIHAANLDGVELRLQEYIQLMEKVGLVDAVNTIQICYVGRKEFPYVSLNKKIQLQHVSENLDDFEVPTQQALWNYAREHPTSKLMYIHTKGVGKELNPCIEDWVHYMNYFCIEKWKEAVEKLETYDTTGVDLLPEPTLHYSGNFWWARASYLQTLPSPKEFTNLVVYPNPLNSERHNQEFWICYKKGKHFCFWQSNINCYHRHVNLYPRNKYAKDTKSEEKSVCIFFLTTNQRQFILPQIVDNLSKCQQRHKLTFLVLTNPNDDISLYQNTLEGKGIDFSIAVIPEDDNYMRKVRYAIQYAETNHIPYLMKHDNDILCSSYLYDFLFENVSLLENPKNLVLTPTLTSGIPTIEQFINDFCSQEEKDILHTLFLQHRFGPLWGADFTPLNQYTVDAKKWSAYDFFKGVKEIPHHYRGVHPVRLYDKAIFILNEIVLRHKQEIFSKRDFQFVYDNFSPYFCNSVFIIKRDTYKLINTSPDLFVDAYDEVPLNKYRDRHNLNIVYTQNGAAIHIIYNCIRYYDLYERMFMNKFNEL